MLRNSAMTRHSRRGSRKYRKICSFLTTPVEREASKFSSRRLILIQILFIAWKTSGVLLLAASRSAIKRHRSFKLINVVVVELKLSLSYWHVLDVARKCYDYRSFARSTMHSIRNHWYLRVDRSYLSRSRWIWVINLERMIVDT